MKNIFIIFFGGILLYRIWSRIRSKTTTPLPLGTLGWPIIGETLEFISSAYSDQPESFMNRRRLKYGKVFKSHLFGSATVISTDAEVSKFILQSDARTFVPSYPSSLTELMGKSSILLINGSLQRRVHGLIGAFFKSPNLKAQITGDMEKYLQESMDSWKDDQLIYIQDVAKNITFHVLVKALISLDPGAEMELLQKHFQEFIAGLMSLPINLPGSQLYRSLQAKKRMVKLVHKILRERRKNCTLSAPKDVVDVLLSDGSKQLTVDLISDNMIDLMIPGEDSVPILMTLAIKYLSSCPRALHQLMEENMNLRRTKIQLGEPLRWTDYMSLSFTQNVRTNEVSYVENCDIDTLKVTVLCVQILWPLVCNGCIEKYYMSYTKYSAEKPISCSLLCLKPSYYYHEYYMVLTR
ncbi:hypothetical protein AQUCO_03700070v1 [Aquilegia coerulea]|uniref:Cytochrome P450 n=1 Tax=Aquilegia coerulea TaxID=218851 RepID=A0A2G5CTC5_AQUCA|nr:hypothetical protein AQUCO_03700070v1 [Aquilegia coerulea]